jgi:peptidoglycan/LPS O-acetylase OafA/YrhL
MNITMHLENPIVLRRFDLDWLRVIAILMVFLFHTGRFFDQMDWHVKNPILYHEMQIWTMFLVTWMMPLIFVISGASIYFALGKVGKFIKDKILRLLVPLVVGVFTHIALCVYLERLTHYQFSGTFLDFYPHYFQGWYGDGGNFAWMGLHLWYLLVLFVFSLVFMPLFYLLKGPGERFWSGLGNVVALPGVFYLLAIPVAWIMIQVNPYSAFGERAWGGWSLLGYVPFFIYGFLIISNESLQTRLKSWRWVSLGLTLVSTIALLYANDIYGNPSFGSQGYAILNGFFGLTAWMWVVSIFGFGMQYLNVQKKFLTFANEAVLPFYILHQTVLLCVGYYVTPLQIPAPAKFAVISLSSFALILLIYVFLIRRINLLRVLFGMKIQSAKPSTQIVAKKPIPA